jgi:hypothetical protein
MKEERVGASISEDESIIGTVKYFSVNYFYIFILKNVSVYYNLFLMFRKR